MPEWKNVWIWIGFAAAALTSTSFIPQILVRLKHPNAARMAYSTLVPFSAGVSLWLLYGIHLGDWIIIGANAFILSNLLVLAAIQWIQERGRTGSPGAGEGSSAN